VLVTFPKFGDGVPATIGFVRDDNVKFTPYTQTSFGYNCDGLSNVLRVAVDPCKRMWVLDAGKIGVCDPQLVIFNLKNDNIVKRFRFQRPLYLNDSLFATPVSY
jgi:Major royal jelly protein